MCTLYIHRGLPCNDAGCGRIASRFYLGCALVQANATASAHIPLDFAESAIFCPKEPFVLLVSRCRHSITKMSPLANNITYLT